MRTLRPTTLAALALALHAATGQVSSAGSAPLRFRDSMTIADFERCGLHKLTAGELAALEAWIAPRLDTTATTGAKAATGEVVAFNTSNGKYHCLSCQWALRCTRSCVNVPLSEARARGVPCKVCGGSCR